MRVPTVSFLRGVQPFLLAFLVAHLLQCQPEQFIAGIAINPVPFFTADQIDEGGRTHNRPGRAAAQGMAAPVPLRKGYARHG